MKYLLLTLLVFLAANSARADNNTAQVQSLQREWAVINYQTKGKKNQLAQYKVLSKKAQVVAEKSPNSAEVKIWQAIILSTQAGAQGGLGALGLVKKARNLLNQAAKINPSALNESAYTSLGSLYYKVPSWPIGFGNKKKAQSYLAKALKINPQGIDPNFFYGEYLMEKGNYEEAEKFLNVAVSTAARPSRPLADKGRREEARALLKKVKSKLGK